MKRNLRHAADPRLDSRAQHPLHGSYVHYALRLSRRESGPYPLGSCHVSYIFNNNPFCFRSSTWARSSPPSPILRSFPFPNVFLLPRALRSMHATDPLPPLPARVFPSHAEASPYSFRLTLFRFPIFDFCLLDPSFFLFIRGVTCPCSDALCFFFHILPSRVADPRSPVIRRSLRRFSPFFSGCSFSKVQAFLSSPPARGFRLPAPLRTPSQENAASFLGSSLVSSLRGKKLSALFGAFGAWLMIAPSPW